MKLQVRRHFEKLQRPSAPFSPPDDFDRRLRFDGTGQRRSFDPGEIVAIELFYWWPFCVRSNRSRGGAYFSRYRCCGQWPCIWLWVIETNKWVRSVIGTNADQPELPRAVRTISPWFRTIRFSHIWFLSIGAPVGIPWLRSFRRRFERVVQRTVQWLYIPSTCHRVAHGYVAMLMCSFFLSFFSWPM